MFMRYPSLVDVSFPGLTDGEGPFQPPRMPGPVLQKAPPFRSTMGGVFADSMWEHRPIDAPPQIGMLREGPCECGGDCRGANAGCGCANAEPESSGRETARMPHPTPEMFCGCLENNFRKDVDSWGRAPDNYNELLGCEPVYKGSDFMCECRCVLRAHDTDGWHTEIYRYGQNDQYGIGCPSCESLWEVGIYRDAPSPPPVVPYDDESCTIEVGATKAGSPNGGPVAPINFLYHLFLTHTDVASDTKTHYQGQPSRGGMHAACGFRNGGFCYLLTGEVSGDDAWGHEGAISVKVGSGDRGWCDRKQKKLESEVNRINAEEIMYGGMNQNSNSFAFTLLTNAGLSVTSPVATGMAPGWGQLV